MAGGRPVLVVVTGPPGSGKTTLAHELARTIGCPAVSRDEIKEGMVAARSDFRAETDDELTRATLDAFFDTLRLLLARGVTVVAEAAFQHPVWAPRLHDLGALAEVVVVRCNAAPDVLRSRIVGRGDRRAHPDGDLIAAIERGEDPVAGFRRIEAVVPTVDVDTSDGYEPPVVEVVTRLGIGAGG